MAVTDRWPELLEAVREDDSLLCPAIKPHTLHKLTFLHRYIDITTTAMVGNPHWPGGVAYLDLFCGPGVGVTKGGTRVPGSPLIAGMSKKPMSAIVCCDLNEERADACKRRLE